MLLRLFNRIWKYVLHELDCSHPRIRSTATLRKQMLLRTRATLSLTCFYCKLTPMASITRCSRSPGSAFLSFLLQIFSLHSFFLFFLPNFLGPQRYSLLMFPRCGHQFTFPRCHFFLFKTVLLPCYGLGEAVVRVDGLKTTYALDKYIRRAIKRNSRSSPIEETFETFYFLSLT